VTQWFDRLVAEIQRSLKSATPEGLEGDGPKVLLLAGGGAREPHVAKTLAARLGLPPRVLEPVGEGSSPALLVARGLADTRPVSGIPVLDLAGIADAEAAASGRRRAMVLGGLGAGLLLAGVGFLKNELDARETAATKLEARLESLKRPVKEVKDLLHEVDVANAWEARKGRSLEVLLATTKALPDKEAYLTRFQWSEGHTVLLAGRAHDEESVTRYVRRLIREPMVERATPDITQRPDRQTEAESKGLSFSITAKLHDLPGEKSK